jgi:multidrug efflux pump subunit AcrA (membrane-fusion protein)
MQVDEYDILKIKKGQSVIVTLDSYKGQTFEAKVTKINPLMNERSKTFIVESEFVKAPELLYPNTSFEANVVLFSREKALLIPRSCLIRDSLVIKSNGDTIKVKTGLKDYQKIEILSGITAADELLIPKE